MWQSEDYVLFGFMALWGDCTEDELTQALRSGGGCASDEVDLMLRLEYWRGQGVIEAALVEGLRCWRLACYGMGRADYVTLYGITGAARAFDRQGNELPHISKTLSPLPQD